MKVDVGGFKGKSRTQHQNVGALLDLPYTGHSSLGASLRSRRGEKEAGLRSGALTFPYSSEDGTKLLEQSLVLIFFFFFFCPFSGFSR